MCRFPGWLWAGSLETGMSTGRSLLSGLGGGRQDLSLGLVGIFLSLSWTRLGAQDGPTQDRNCGCLVHLPGATTPSTLSACRGWRKAELGSAGGWLVTTCLSGEEIVQTVVGLGRAEGHTLAVI